jgi:Cu(I)-responsive transcriptional regulator
MQIGTVARKSGVPAKTIRYYESVGLIDQAGRSASGYRVYGLRDIQTLRFISRARGLGFSVKDVADLLALWRDQARSSAQVKHLASDHLGQIDRKIAELRAVRATLVDLIERCSWQTWPHPHPRPIDLRRAASK